MNWLTLFLIFGYTVCGSTFLFAAWAFVTGRLEEPTPAPVESPKFTRNEIPIFALGLLGFVILFWPSVATDNLVLFSNDGPLGYMTSAHYSQAVAQGPGTPFWNDLNWLGAGGNETPVNVSYVLLWMFYNPWAILLVLCLAAIALVTRALLRRGLPFHRCRECGQFASSRPASPPLCDTCWKHHEP